jgi:hypothetical protein
MRLTALELDLLELVLEDYIDNLNPTLEAKLNTILEKIKQLNKQREGALND